MQEIDARIPCLSQSKNETLPSFTIVNTSSVLFICHIDPLRRRVPGKMEINGTDVKLNTQRLARFRPVETPRRIAIVGSHSILLQFDQASSLGRRAFEGSLVTTVREHM
jgi:hypothetical protein